MRKVVNEIRRKDRGVNYYANQIQDTREVIQVLAEELEKQRKTSLIYRALFCMAILILTTLLIVRTNRPDSHSAIVTDKFEKNGACFIEVIVPIDSDTYIGLDVGDECFIESD